MQEKLNILFLSNRVPYPVKDGQSRRTYNILKGLAQKNNVYLLSLGENADEKNSGALEHLSSFCSQVELVASPPKALSISMMYRLLRSLFSTTPYTMWRHYSMPYRKRVRELLGSGKFNLVHCDIMPIAYIVRDIKSVPCALTDHDVCHVKAARIAKQCRNVFLKLFLYLEAAKLRHIETRIFSEAAMGVAVSQVDKTMLQRLCPKGKFIVAENGVDISEFQPAGKGPEPDTLIWVGGFGYAPNREALYWFLREIYPLIKKDVPTVRFTVVGGAVPKRMGKLFSQDRSIKQLGYVEELLPHIQKAAVFVVPLLSGSGTRLKTIEAMAAGKAIVTTGVGCEGIEGAQQKHFLIADTAAHFAQGVVTLLRNAELRKKLEKNARILAEEKYDWKLITAKLDGAYKDLTGKRARQPLCNSIQDTVPA